MCSSLTPQLKTSINVSKSNQSLQQFFKGAKVPRFQYRVNEPNTNTYDVEGGTVASTLPKKKKLLVPSYANRHRSKVNL